MDTKALLQSNYLDIIFDGRNKKYGSYELRTSYPQRMKKAGIYIFSAALVLMVYNAWAGRVKPLPPMPEMNKPVVMTEVEIEPITPKEQHVEPPAPPAPPAGPKLKTEIALKPEIIEDQLVQPNKTMVNQDDMKNAVASDVKMTGDDLGSDASDLKGGVPNGTGSDNVVVGGDGTNPKSDEPEKFVQQMPEFPGGEKKMMAFLADNIQYPAKASNAGKQGEVRVKFVVNKDGSISDIQVVKGFGYGSEEEAARVVSSMPKWKPGRNNGVPVRVWFYLPIRFILN